MTAVTTEEYYTTRFGVGLLKLADGLPLEHEIPDPNRVAPVDATAGPWALLLERYFGGERVSFPLDPGRFSRAVGHTQFEAAVTVALAAIPYGSAVSYRDLAVAAGHPNAYRAVGSVMARNPLPVILPCHRVIKNDGSLGNYGDDPAWKRRLLTLEGYFTDRGRESM